MKRLAEIQALAEQHPDVILDCTPDHAGGVWVSLQPGYCWGTPQEHAASVRSAAGLRRALGRVTPCRCWQCLPADQYAIQLAADLYALAGAQAEQSGAPASYHLRLTLEELLRELERRAMELEPEHPILYLDLLEALQDAIADRLQDHRWQ